MRAVPPLVVLASLVAVAACGSSDDAAPADSILHGAAGASTAGAAGSGGNAGSTGKSGSGGGHAGTAGGATAGHAGTTGTSGSGGKSTGGAAGQTATGGAAGQTGTGGAAGSAKGGTTAAGTGGMAQAGSGGSGVAGTTSAGMGGSTATGGAAGSTGTAGTGTAGMGGSASLPAGWLYTQGSSILVADGAGSGTPWMGRGVNMDDLFLCGFNYTLWKTDAEQSLQTIVDGLLQDWKPNFVRVSLGMASYPTTVSWVSGDASQYKTPMTNVIQSFGKTPGVYVLVALRSDASMIGQDQVDGDPEATGLPSDATTTPDANAFPNGTDDVYRALVDTFANDPFVLFGLTNEPGGNKLSNDQIRAAMDHAVGVIRAEEDALGVPHHIVSVQGNGWTSDISFYASSPLAWDDVVYEVHGYPPDPSSYTYANIPVILGEYGSLPDASAFFADVEAKQIPNLAWDFEPYSDCTPDLLQVTQDATMLNPQPWGSTVQAYLLSHAP